MINSKDISVVVQGAINEKLTPKCLESIRKYLPDAEIILSTWKGSIVEGLNYDKVILSEDPGGFKHDYAFCNARYSINNLNRQLVSTNNGLKEVHRKYALKLRSDLVLKNSNFLKYWDKFNVRNNEYKLFNHRVLSGSLYSREYSCQGGTGFPIPFHPSDFWFFGLSEDIKSYFLDCPMQTKEEASNWNFKYPNRCPYITPLFRYAPEQWFCVNWVKKYYPDLQFDDWSDWNEENIELSNNILYNNFIFLDFEQSGIYSAKHSKAEFHKSTIQGLITYQHFQEQYKNYCDETFKLNRKKEYYKGKLKKHAEKFIAPFCKIKYWLSEMFSVIYYSLAVIFTRWWKNDN